MRFYNLPALSRTLSLSLLILFLLAGCRSMRSRSATQADIATLAPVATVEGATLDAYPTPPAQQSATSEASTPLSEEDTQLIYMAMVFVASPVVFFFWVYWMAGLITRRYYK